MPELEGNAYGRGLAASPDGIRARIVKHIDNDARVMGVESELYSALSNLLNNAVRYSPEGGDIEVSWTREGDDACLSIQDHGMGIPPEHLARLTERFYRVDLAGSRVRGGTGLGLAITKHVLKRHNTHLQIESSVGSGSRFYCQFPVSQLESPNH